MVGNAHVTLCLSPLSPRGVKARRAMSMKRGKGCGECSNRWDESSVLVRYVLLLSYCNYLFCFLLFFVTLCFPVTFVCIVQLFCLSCHILFIPHLPVSIFFSLFFRLLFLCLPRFTSLPTFSFTICLVLEMLPKTTSTLCFLLLALECKKQREEEKALGKKTQCTVMSSH